MLQYSESGTCWWLVGSVGMQRPHAAPTPGTHHAPTSCSGNRSSSLPSLPSPHSCFSPVQHHAPHRLQREQVLRPDLGDVQRVKLIGVSALQGRRGQKRGGVVVIVCVCRGRVNRGAEKLSEREMRTSVRVGWCSPAVSIHAAAGSAGDQQARTAGSALASPPQRVEVRVDFSDVLADSPWSG